MSENVSVDMSQHFYRASAADFMKIPGSPVAYWASKSAVNNFTENPLLEDVGLVRQGASTSDNNRFLRLWFEVPYHKIGLTVTNLEAARSSGKKWFPYNKGGDFKKWFGNQDFIINYENDGKELKEFQSTLNQGWTARLKSREYYFKESISWSKISSGSFSCRFYPTGFVFDVAGCCYFPKGEHNYGDLVCFLNSSVAKEILKFLSPTLNFEIEHIKKLPYIEVKNESYSYIYETHLQDWHNFETSWDFSSLPLLAKDSKQLTLDASYKTLRANWLASTLEMQRLEEENNRIFIDAYGLKDELTPEVPLNEITLTCNPHYRYRGDLTEQEREDRLQSDTIAELISYAVGCMMGRYSLDREGLVYANEGNEGFAELVAEGAYKTFPADGDGILALTAEEWFEEDIANRFSEFLAQVWGEESLQQNIDFVAQSLCLYALKARSGETSMEVIRRYLSTQFFKDHMSMYKRRPIYWLFSSGRHKAFECLVYLHRYNESTLARMRTEYVIPHTARLSAYATRLAARIEAADSTAERNRLNREQKKIHDQQAELAAFDEQLRHAADQRIQLDLDDGVRVNYGKFGNLLAEVKAIAG